MMTVEKAIELLGDLIYYSYSASQSDTGDALKMAIKGLQLLSRDKAHKLDSVSLKLLLGAEGEVEQ